MNLAYNNGIEMKILVVLKVVALLTLGPAIYTYESFDKGQGQVVDKIHILSHTKEIDFYSIILDAEVTEHRVIPDTYKLVIDYQGREKSLCVSYETHMQFEKGDVFTRRK